MAATNIDDKLIEEITRDLRERYRLDADELAEVGRRLASEEEARQAENDEFADRFMAEHAETFERLSK
jgi:hypothetical protein